ncbi:hypothetical protein AB4037_08675 [Labrys sp. KB_33_2]|uniref:hypothetical protein n=1 Tax=Labrys sp. KB_33_2 TaxID=3237479 RepID=UPI003F8E11A5
MAWLVKKPGIIPGNAVLPGVFADSHHFHLGWVSFTAIPARDRGLPDASYFSESNLPKLEDGNSDE